MARIKKNIVPADQEWEGMTFCLDNKLDKLGGKQQEKTNSSGEIDQSQQTHMWINLLLSFYKKEPTILSETT